MEINLTQHSLTKMISFPYSLVVFVCTGVKVFSRTNSSFLLFANSALSLFSSFISSANSSSFTGLYLKILKKMLEYHQL